MGLPPFRWMGFFGALSALSYIERMGEGKCLKIIKILKKNDLKKCSFMRRIKYPDALQRCKFDASLLAAGYLIVLRCMVRSD